MYTTKGIKKNNNNNLLHSSVANRTNSQITDVQWLQTSLSIREGDWLAALPVATCRLRLDDEAICVGVVLWLGLNVCVPHDCSCGQMVDSWGLHALLCKHAPGRIQRYHAFNDIIARALVSAGIPVCKEPSGLFTGDIGRPDCLILIPWQAG